MVRRGRPQPLVWVVAALALFITALWQQRAEITPVAPAAPQLERAGGASPDYDLSAVPAPERAQLRETLALIDRGGPFPYPKDGTLFGNREGRLPAHPRGYYREYTVPTPGANDRGARRVVRGRGGETWYTRDHYRTFVRIDR